MNFSGSRNIGLRIFDNWMPFKDSEKKGFTSHQPQWIFGRSYINSDTISVSCHGCGHEAELRQMLVLKAHKKADSP